MDQTEITNNEYRQFVHWVRDSIIRKYLAEDDPDKWGWPKDPNPNWNSEKLKDASSKLIEESRKYSIFEHFCYILVKI